MLRLLELTMFIFLLSIGLTVPINNVFAVEGENNINGTAGPSFIDQVSTNPLVLLLVGGIGSTVFVAWITRHWQTRSENFQIRSQLVTKINKSSTKLIVALEFSTREGSLDEKLMRDVFREWRETSAEIGATVRVHWHRKVGHYENPVVTEWNAYFKTVIDLYHIIRDINTRDEDFKKKKSKMEDYLINNDVFEELEYFKEDCKTAFDNFFKVVEEPEKPVSQMTEELKTVLANLEILMSKGKSEQNSAEVNLPVKKDIGRCVTDLLYFVDKRKYYLLTLIFKESIIPYSTFFKFKI